MHRCCIINVHVFKLRKVNLQRFKFKDNLRVKNAVSNLDDLTSVERIISEL